jgi:glycosidase
VDRRLGTESDLVELVEQAGRSGLRVLLDGVFNHVSRAHPLFQQALREGPDSYAAQHFRIDWRDGSARPEVFEGHGDLVALELSRQPAQDLVVEVMCYWLDRGVAGWRLDAAYAVAPWAWQAILDRVRARHPEALVFGEVLHGDYPGFVRESGLDSVTQYELWKGIWSSIADRNLFELDWALRRHGEFLADFVPVTFVGNHDVTRIASQVGHPGAVVALAVLLTVGGTPVVYAGDERGWLGHKTTRVGGDDEVRPEFPADPSGLDELDPTGWQWFRVHQQLLHVRRCHPWLTRAQTTTTQLENRRMSYRSVNPLDPQADWLEVTIDLTDRPWVQILGPAGVQFAG